MTAKDTLLAILSDRVIAYHVTFAKVGGGATAGLFLSQLFYWTGKGAKPGGWVWKSAREMEAETGLTKREQQTARKRLKARGLIEEKLAGIPATVHYRVDIEKLIELVNKMVQNARSVGTKSANYSENTSENTTDISATAPPEEPLSEEKEPERETIPSSKQSESEAGKVRAEPPPTPEKKPCSACGVICCVLTEMNGGVCLHCIKDQGVKPPTDPPKKKPNGTYLLAELLAEVCAMDFEANKGRLLREAKQLKKAKPPPSGRLVRAHYGPDGTWYKKDFRGKRGEPPAPSAIRQTWKQYAGEARPEQKKTVPFSKKMATRVYT